MILSKYCSALICGMSQVEQMCCELTWGASKCWKKNEIVRTGKRPHPTPAWDALHTQLTVFGTPSKEFEIAEMISCGSTARKTAIGASGCSNRR